MTIATVTALLPCSARDASHAKVSAMLTILSPAKNLDFETIPCTRHASQPEFVEASSELVGLLRPMTAQQLGESDADQPQAGRS